MYYIMPYLSRGIQDKRVESYTSPVNGENHNRFSGFGKAEAEGRQEAGCNGCISFLRSKKLTAQKRQGGRFWAAQGIEVLALSRKAF
jgi:hypothetical protein